MKLRQGTYEELVVQSQGFSPCHQMTLGSSKVTGQSVLDFWSKRGIQHN